LTQIVKDPDDCAHTDDLFGFEHEQRQWPVFPVEEHKSNTRQIQIITRQTQIRSKPAAQIPTLTAGAPDKSRSAEEMQQSPRWLAPWLDFCLIDRRQPHPTRYIAFDHDRSGWRAVGR
jgi:hypothetical protein